MTFQLHPPRLPDRDTTCQMIQSSLTHRVTGRVSAVTGETIEIQGMTAPLGAICELNPAPLVSDSTSQKTVSDHAMNRTSCRAKVIGFRGVHPILAPMERLGPIAAGDPIRLLDTSTKIRVGDALCGRVVDAFGDPLDGRPLPEDLKLVDCDLPAPESLDRPPIDTPLETGIRAIDGMLTCGHGQRLGIFAGSGVGKSTLLGMLARNSSADRIVIGMVGERGREVQEFIDRSLGAEGLASELLQPVCDLE